MKLSELDNKIEPKSVSLQLLNETTRADSVERTNDKQRGCCVRKQPFGNDSPLLVSLSNHSIVEIGQSCDVINLMIFHFNFMHIHAAHGQTPAMAADLTNFKWTFQDLLLTPD